MRLASMRLASMRLASMRQASMRQKECLPKGGIKLQHHAKSFFQ